MSNNGSKSPFLEIGFRSASSEGSLQTIELIGVPGQQLSNGEYAVSDKARLFFDDLIVRSLFRKSRFISDCDFQYLKIWLYDTEISDQERGYEIPKLDQKDLWFSSKKADSKLKKIYILDNGLEGEEFDRWKKVCKELFGSLFTNFIAPPEPPDVIGENIFLKPLLGLIDHFTDAIDRYGSMKRKLFFDALIIQVD